MQSLESCSIKNTVKLACLLHDAGKYSDEFQSYIIRAYENPNSTRRGEVVHSTAGAQLIKELISPILNRTKGEILSLELIRHAVISHHGLSDCIEPDGGLIFAKRNTKTPLDEAVKNRFFEDFEREELDGLAAKSSDECENLVRDIMEFLTKNKNIGNAYWYIGMCERLLLSYLIDADRTDTAIFDGNTLYEDNYARSEVNSIFTQMRDNLDKKLARFTSNSPVKAARSEISSVCRRAGDSKPGVFRLTVPTGGGKTFSVMSFALEHAICNGMQRIIYVAPYNSILEQNADALRSALGGEQYILEHHCNVISEDENGDELKKYEVLTERWNSPIIITSAVQLLNTLFSSKTSSIRRFHTLENSIIIFDEIQSLPIKCTSVFNLAVNYLNRYCGTTVVLCSATQPPLSNMLRNCMIPTVELVDNYMRYFDIFKRTEIICDIDREYTAEELAEFVIEKTNNNMLIVVNTKNAARSLYEKIESINDGRFKLYHLSTTMCAAHRRNVISELRDSLSSKEKCICVSTQLIEAGVDISFEKAIRSLSGLDNIVQTSGRCNRDGSNDLGQVYVVKFKDEKLSKLKDILLAQQAMEKFIYIFNKNPQNFGGSLLSTEAMAGYYKVYFNKRESDDHDVYDFSCRKKYGTTLVKLLSENSHGFKESLNKCKNPEEAQCFLRQAFKSAGDEFEVIEDVGKCDLVVSYEQSEEYIEQLHSSIDLKEKYKLIKKLQSYTVSVFKYTEDKLGDYIEFMPDIGVKILDKRCYDEKFGISDEPGEMENLIF